ncbi:Spc97/Spc98 family protein [Trichophyton equinum CBS 127.97]|uniref:Spindle pole body component n=1 Tax=Trichophyton equinum (strain ATCC MYA-4606 / CBS 127.97) TaxID=559882 RepID=F2PV25_TRIEC|nr:Spc97/Spc98 family protein [Trichophyton equinum CBS 127.97]
MLHEILLSLSGQPSPIFEQSAKDRGAPQDGFPLLSPQEKALLEPIARLSQLHSLLRAHAELISSSHPSTVCRAASTTISTEYLGNFQEKILEVEQAILARDAGYVGGYGIVPLSTIVGEFFPWVRKLEWLWETSQFMLPYVDKDAKSKGTPAGKGCTGAALLDYLRTESQTGYTDVEEISLGLIKAAETAWMRQLSVFIFYGQLPSLGREDFFIQEKPSNGNRRTNTADFILRPELVPKFVSRPTATSILFVGRSLSHIRARGKFPAGEEAKHSSSQMTLHGEFIRTLSSLSSPISMINLANAVSEIRLALSHTVLSQLLPLHKIMEVLSLLHNFLLLGRGEFAMALSLFLTDVPFTHTLRSLISHVDRFVSLLGQLQTIQQNLDLETDEGVFDSLQDYAQDEARVWAEVSAARTDLESSMTELIARLRDIDDHRTTKGATSLDISTRHSHPALRWVKGNEETMRGRLDNNVFVPWRAAGVDRLLMRLEFGGASADDHGADTLDFGGNTVFAE